MKVVWQPPVERRAGQTRLTNGANEDGCRASLTPPMVTRPSGVSTGAATGGGKFDRVDVLVGRARHPRGSVRGSRCLLLADHGRAHVGPAGDPGLRLPIPRLPGLGVENENRATAGPPD